MSDAMRDARGNVRARMEHEMECASTMFGGGPCDCDRDVFVAKLELAAKQELYAAIRQAVEGVPPAVASCAEDVEFAAAFNAARQSFLAAIAQHDPNAREEGTI